MAIAMDVKFEGFEFSFETLKLRKNGAEVRLVGQPMHLLVMLLQRPGVVISREEIRERLWPDTHVDFDHSVHAALNRLRAVLGDSGKHPRFIETVPTVGYRFLAKVEVVAPATLISSSPSSSSSGLGRVARRAMWLTVVAVVVALLTYAYVRQHYDQFVPRRISPVSGAGAPPR
jgi:DNA-binding winged helix-turn-helix (wHTH) protein